MTCAAYEPTLLALGHCMRKLKRLPAAADAYNRALSLRANAPGTLSALGYTLHLQVRPDEAHGGGMGAWRSALTRPLRCASAARMAAAGLLPILGHADARGEVRAG